MEAWALERIAIVFPLYVSESQCSPIFFAFPDSMHMMLLSLSFYATTYHFYFMFYLYPFFIFPLVPRHLETL